MFDPAGNTATTLVLVSLYTVSQDQGHPEFRVIYSQELYAKVLDDRMPQHIIIIFVPVPVWQYQYCTVLSSRASVAQSFIQRSTDTYRNFTP